MTVSVQLVASVDQAVHRELVMLVVSVHLVISVVLGAHQELVEAVLVQLVALAVQAVHRELVMAVSGQLNKLLGFFLATALPFLYKRGIHRFKRDVDVSIDTCASLYLFCLCKGSCSCESNRCSNEEILPKSLSRQTN